MNSDHNHSVNKWSQQQYHAIFLCLALATCGGVAAAADTASGKTTTISDFHDFHLDALYASWSSATIVSSPTNYQVTASGYGSGYTIINPGTNASGATSIELTVTISGPPEVMAGPVISLVDDDGTQVDFAWYGRSAGTHVLEADLSSGVVKSPGTIAGLDLSKLKYLHLQVDPGTYTGQYAIVFEKLTATGAGNTVTVYGSPHF
jgi:hypothetical protein